MSPIQKIRPYTGMFGLVVRPQRTVLEHLPAAESTLPPRHCILIHGWGANNDSMRQWADMLAATEEGKTTHFWLPTYDTAWRTFAQSANIIKGLLENTGHDFSRTLILGYSMGGLVARQMASEGFPCQQLVTLCSPHHGPAPWIPLWWRKTSTLAATSGPLGALNNSFGDGDFRSKYHFWGMTYRDPAGSHQHDGIVEISSALGQDLGEAPNRQIFSVDMQKAVMGFGLPQPHVCALYPELVPEAFENVVKLLKEL